MSIASVGTWVVAIATIGSLPVAAAQTQSTLTPKHRLAGSYFWQQSKPPEQKPEPKPEPKTEAKPATAATLAGRWTANIESPNGPVSSAVDLKSDPKDAKKVTGTITSPQGETALEGEVADGKLTFSIAVNANGTELVITFVGSVQKDGSLAGTLSFAGQGEMTWTAVREKK